MCGAKKIIERCGIVLTLIFLILILLMLDVMAALDMKKIMSLWNTILR